MSSDIETVLVTGSKHIQSSYIMINIIVVLAVLLAAIVIVSMKNVDTNKQVDKIDENASEPDI